MCYVWARFLSNLSFNITTNSYMFRCKNEREEKTFITLFFSQQTEYINEYERTMEEYETEISNGVVSLRVKIQLENAFIHEMGQFSDTQWHTLLYIYMPNLYHA